MCEWKTLRLGDIVSLVIDHRGKTPKKLCGDWSESGYRALSAKTVKTRQIVNADSIRFVGEEMYRRWMKDEVRRGDILVTSEAPYGEILYWNSDEKIVLSQRLFGLRINDEHDSAFVAHFMTSPFFRSEMDSRATGTTVFGLRQPELLDCKVHLPDLPTQKKIAAVLSALDDKIENNRRICKTLEEMAQAIFKSWFVDFEPWGGVMPAGWREGALGDLALYGDGRISVKEITPSTYFSTENMISEKGGAVDATYMPEDGFVPSATEGCVLVSNIRPYFKKIVRVNEAVVGRSADVLCFAPRQKELGYYLYRLLWDDAFFAYVMSGAKGTKMPRGDKAQIIAYPCVVPNGDWLSAFNVTIETIERLIISSRKEIILLASMRDALLPKLMSGEIDMDKVEV